MIGQRRSVGLDVHARSVAAAAIDGQTGEVSRRKMTPDRAEILAWIVSLAGPVRVVYEAGPTGLRSGRVPARCWRGVCGGGTFEVAASLRG